MKHFATTMLAFGTMLAALPTAHADTTCPQQVEPETAQGGSGHSRRPVSQKIAYGKAAHPSLTSRPP